MKTMPDRSRPVNMQPVAVTIMPILQESLHGALDKIKKCWTRLSKTESVLNIVAFGKQKK
jgi:hypothetical protein